jgi:hypothetical protein
MAAARRARGTAAAAAALAGFAAWGAAGCAARADLEPGRSLMGTLDGNDFDQQALWLEHGIAVADIEASLAATKGAPRLLQDSARRYDVLTLRLRGDSRTIVRVASADFNPVVAVTDLGGKVLGADDDASAAATDALVVVDNPLGAATVLVVVTEFGAPRGGAYLVEANLD